MKIYTKSGDKGTTALIGGRRVPKNDLRIEAYGTVDELISFTGLVRDHADDEKTVRDLVRIQDQLMVCAAILSTPEDARDARIPKLSDEDIVWIETNIDRMEEELPPISNFVLPGGHPSVSFAHVARTICRRAERVTLTLSESAEVPELILRYLNRLSDYFFVLSRYLSSLHRAVEIPWQPLLD